MRPYSALIIVITLISICACRSDFSTVANSGKLTFSRDTVYLDTVFSNIASSTYLLKVYNKSKNDINIPTVKLGKGLDSKYRITVDGMQGNNNKLFRDIVLLAKDSMYIFIETTADISDAAPSDFLYTDAIEFDSGDNLQKVPLVTLIQDAVFLYPKRYENGIVEKLNFDDSEISGFYLDENDEINGNELHFTNKKPYVIYGYAAVPSGKTAIFDPGSRVHFHVNSGLLIPEDATINVNGEASETDKLENEIIFEGDRLEPEYAEIPGQWGTIWLYNSNTFNRINHLTIKNATVGILIQNKNNTSLSVKNSQLYNCSNYGILAETATIEGDNMVINNSGLVSLACTYGGDYQFTHCTFNNNWNSSRSIALSINNIKGGANPETKDLTKATFNNCIIYGSNSNELILTKNGASTFEYQFNNCLIKSTANNADPLYLFNSDTSHYKEIILNQNPKFYKPNQNKLLIDNTSAAFAQGNPSYLISEDIIGNTRTSPPDLGAYQNMPFPE